MIGFPLSVSLDGTTKVLGPAIATGSCVQLVFTTPDAVVDHLGPFVLPAGDFNGPESYISWTSAGGDWIGTAELVDFAGNVLAMATISGSAAVIVDGPGVVLHSPFDNSVNVPSDTLAFIRLSNTDAGPVAVISWYLEMVKAGAIPIITTPPALTWSPEIGNSPVLTDPIYTGTATSITWTLYRDGVPDDTIVNVSKAVAEAYVGQWDGTASGINDIGPQLQFKAKVANGSGADTSLTNTVVFDDATYLPSAAIWANPDNSLMTLQDGNTTVDQWASGWGGVSCTLAAPASTHRPAYSAGGIGGRPVLTFDGVDDFLRGTFTKGSDFTDHEIGIVGERVAFGTLGDIWFGYWRPNSALFYLNDQDSTRFRFTSLGAANVAPSSTYNPTGVLAHYSGDAAATTVNARVNGTVQATGTGTVATYGDNNTVIMGGSQTSTVGPYGTVAANIVVHAAYITPVMTASQRLHMRALLTYHTGVAC